MATAECRFGQCDRYKLMNEFGALWRISDEGYKALKLSSTDVPWSFGMGRKIAICGRVSAKRPLKLEPQRVGFEIVPNRAYSVSFVMA